MTDIILREATPADLETLVAMQAALGKETEQTTLDAARLRDGIGRLLGTPELGRYLLAADPAGVIVGCLLRMTEWSTWQNAEVWWLHDVYVQPAWRHRGVFQQLYARVRSEAMQNPRVLGVRLYVNRNNAVARRTYERLGMHDAHWALYEWMAR